MRLATTRVTTAAKPSVLVVGASGEFGQFLRHDILPALGVVDDLEVERDTPTGEAIDALRRSRHVILATPLAGYAERACELVYRLRESERRVTLWLIPSVQAGVWRAVTATLSIVGNPLVSAVFVHPMYGPNGFRATEREARTFQNILTATHAGVEHPLAREVTRIGAAFRDAFNIGTTEAFDPEEHDRITAYSQGLSYCVGRLMFDRSDLDDLVRSRMPDLHHSFHANHDLILDFVRINAYMPQVVAAFNDAWGRTSGTTGDDVLRAFGAADASLNGGAESSIPTKWYEKLRQSARSLGDVGD